MKNLKDREKSPVFPLGQKIPEEFKEYFTGNTFLHNLVPGDSEYNCPVWNVTFEPGCINSWHVHAGGQILLVTGGRGYYQEEGREARELLPGDVVMIPAHIKHWHGAAKDSWFSHIAIETNPQAGPVEWLEEVDEKEYSKLK